MKTALAIAVLAFVTAPACAGAFRADQPPVLPTRTPEPVRSSLEDAPWNELRDELARLGQPRFVVSWNVAFDHEIADATRRVHTDIDEREGERFEHEESAAADTSTRFLESGWREAGRRTQVDETRRIDADARDAATRSADWAMEPLFAGELARAGMRLVDGRMATRKGSLDVATSDRQAAEMRGLERYADFLVEVTVQRAPGTPLGRNFRVAIIATADGGKLVDFLSDGTVRFRGDRPYVAGVNGFERVPPPQATPDMAVRQLAADTAGALLAALR